MEKQPEPHRARSLRSIGLRLFASVCIGGALFYLAFRELRPEDLLAAFGQADYIWLLPYLGTLAGVHFLRAIRWGYLLDPLMASTPGPWRLLAISSVGFAAIILVPFRLGELVRPYLIADPKGDSQGAGGSGPKGERLRMSAALGTIAVERAVDGLLVSFLLCASFLILAQRPTAPSWMLPTAFTSLAVFGGATAVLALGLWRPRWAVAIALTATLIGPLGRLLGGRMNSLRLRLEDLLIGTISGFAALSRAGSLTKFVGLTLVYWGLNGLGFYVLARAFHLELSVVGAFALCGTIAIGVVLPAGPGLVGNFHEFGKVGLQVSLPASIIAGPGMAYIVLTHGIQLIWYVGVGLLFLRSPHVRERGLLGASEATSEAPRAPAT
ncbi:MAG: lysylphosphatidylglycerol synthase transmembrane domain-containing protein [Polyangia bacterium]|jgi:uncharacterized membrane protein YbhN (UPF0104 family)|nr:lysylphosphatidylglycerol synthase transmembrane domain-containing protein [Polyangia bacterium]